MNSYIKDSGIEMLAQSLHQKAYPKEQLARACAHFADHFEMHSYKTFPNLKDFLDYQRKNPVHTKPTNKKLCKICSNSGWMHWEDKKHRSWVLPCKCEAGEYIYAKPFSLFLSKTPIHHIQSTRNKMFNILSEEAETIPDSQFELATPEEITANFHKWLEDFAKEYGNPPPKHMIAAMNPSQITKQEVFT